MVGYRGEGDLSSSESAVAGAVSGAVTRASASPLDILKIRFQLQIENMKQTGKESDKLLVSFGKKRESKLSGKDTFQAS
jgi:hypothetical protein